jgi:putative membrane protein
LQLFLFRMTDMIFRGIPDLIERDIAAPAVVLGAFKIAGSIILAFAIAG